MSDESVKLKTERRRYPYSKSRVYLSTIMTISSLILALTLLLEESILMLLYYFFFTIILTVATFLLKVRLYAFLMREKFETEKNQARIDRTPWKALLLVFCMLIAFVTIPLLLAGFLSGVLWVILILGFTTGVSISEIVLYFHTRIRKAQVRNDKECCSELKTAKQ